MLLEKEAVMTISKEMLDELQEGCERPEDLLGDTGLMKALKIKLMERILGAELTEHQGYEEGAAAPPSQPNCRNGSSKKIVKSEDSVLPLAVPPLSAFASQLPAGQWMVVSSPSW